MQCAAIREYDLVATVAASSFHDVAITNPEWRTQFPNHPLTPHPPTMSYAGPVQSRSTRRPAAARTSAVEFGEAPEWHHVALFGAGVALGITVGAGLALLIAPQSGAETRADIGRGADRARGAVRGAGTDAWNGVRSELRRITRALRRRKEQQEAAHSLEDPTALP